MTAPYYQDEQVTVLAGDCLDVLRTLPDNSVHAVCTDPPYGLANTDPAHVAETITRWVNGDRTYLPGGSGFMGKSWDAFVPPVAVWDECLRVLKPGGHVLAFAGSRTHDLMTLGIRLAGFEIRDSIAWLYGSGFPKSLDVSKAIDKAAGVEREVTGTRPGGYGAGSTLSRATQAMYGYRPPGEPYPGDLDGTVPITAPATPEAERWQGWGTALKPSHEPIVVARKPLEGTVAANVLEHGTGALNIDACRVAMSEADREAARVPQPVIRKDNYTVGGSDGRNGDRFEPATGGRWPTNVVLDDTQAAELDRQSGESTSSSNPDRFKGTAKFNGSTYAGDDYSLNMTRGAAAIYGDTGGASRFFPTFRYEAKAPTEERPRVNGIAHPTVKPLDLMRWLVRLVTPPGGTVLDPFAGSGTTAEACVIEGFQHIAIEREADYLPLIKARLTKPLEPVLDLGALS